MKTLNEHSDLSRRSNKTLVTWWRILNEWGWPKEFGVPEPRRSTNARRLAIMEKILRTLGYKAIYRDGKLGGAK